MALFARIGFAAVSYPSAEEFLNTEPTPAQFGCVVSEMKLPGASGLELLATLRSNNSRLPMIILTDDADIGHAVTALHEKVSDYLLKPVIERELIKRIQVALRGPGRMRRPKQSDHQLG